MDPQQERHEMAVFIKKALFFLLPIAVYFGVSLAILVAAGEMTPVDEVIKAQKNASKPILFGPAYTNPDKYYKLRSVLERGPEVMALGSSEVMEFRSKFFKKDVRFFNAGGGVDAAENFAQFLRLIPKGKEPKVIIVGLDWYFFNPRYRRDNSAYTEKRFLEGPNYLSAFLESPKIYADYFQKKFTLKDVFNRREDGRIGMSAIIRHKGFRNDGSYYYGNLVEHPNSPAAKRRFDDTFERISNGNLRFEYGRDFSPKAVEALREFLKECRLRNIHVVGFLSPLPHVTYEKMKAMGDNYAYIFKLEPVLKDLFSQNGFNYFDFLDMAIFSATDDEATDGFHGSQKAYLRLFITMAERDEVLRRYAEDLEGLKDRIRDATGPYEVFPENEF